MPRMHPGKGLDVSSSRENQNPLTSKGPWIDRGTCFSTGFQKRCTYCSVENSGNVSPKAEHVGNQIHDNVKGLNTLQ